MKILLQFTAILAMSLLAGCAMYMPVSDGIVFNDENIEPYGKKSRLLGLKVGEGGGGLSYVALPGTFRDNLRKEFAGRVENDIGFKQTYLVSLPVPLISFPLTDRAAFGMSGFPIFPGFDATVRLVEEIHLTGNIQFPLIAVSTNSEVILQRPVWRTGRYNNKGISLGAFFRSEKLSLKREFDNSSLRELVPENFRLDWFGGRILGQIPFDDNEKRVRLFFNAGYSSRFDAPVFAFGFSLFQLPKPPRPRINPVRF